MLKTAKLFVPLVVEAVRFSGASLHGPRKRTIDASWRVRVTSSHKSAIFCNTKLFLELSVESGHE